ncbi:DUF493 family protein [Aerosticca soli]|uniref:Proposed lipoate regulatory protein YbeD n=1 Tax=Aerosticca soli TaxID=2010829 RepID=A0A2Z6E6T8_9GAMM|nr:DUF493 family protein [Aerosticca soli]MDI3262208.1 DUF493 family protein [Fulvimonas sp.]BBD80885.1 proposed lipoate regulatory protein YbeD [Aerosticca soli]
MTHEIDPARAGGKGFVFPGEFEITAMGDARANLETRVPAILAGLGLDVRHESVRERPSRAGRFVAVTVRFHCRTREQYAAAHAALRDDPDIRYTL